MAKEEIIDDEESLPDDILKEMEEFNEEDSTESENKDEIEELKKEMRDIKEKVTGTRDMAEDIEFGGIPPSADTNLQWNGSSYMTTVPRNIAREFNLRKKDILKWRKAKYDTMDIILITVEKTGRTGDLREPFEEREEQ